jgi:hypothetical protein
MEGETLSTDTSSSAFGRDAGIGWIGALEVSVFYYTMLTQRARRVCSHRHGHRFLPIRDLFARFTALISLAVRFKPWVLTAYGSRQPSAFERSLEDNDSTSENDDSESENDKSDS